MGWWTAPQFEDPQKTRRARLLMTVLQTMTLLGTVGAIVSFFDPLNDISVWAAFYVSTFSATAALTWLVHRGRVELAAWVVCGWFWVLIAFVTLFFGGMKGQNAAVFGVSVMLGGAVVGGRSAIGLAVLSSLWCAGVAWLEREGRLPAQLGPYTPLNAWTAITVTLGLMSVLLKNSLDSLEALHRRAEVAARERDEALRRSIQSQKLELVGRLTSGIAHDLNNLLAVITSSVAFLQMRTAADAEADEALRDLDAAAEGAALVTRQLLAFGRTRSGATEVVSLSEAVTQFLPIAKRLAGSNVIVETHVPPEVSVVAHRSAIEQVLLNLVTNAVDAMPEGGTLTLRIELRGERVALSVADTGVGMDEATRGRIFEPFFTTREKGTGLGLATVKRVSDEVGAQLEVESAPGRGSTFTALFQRAAAPLASPVPFSGQSRVLLVDDDVLVRRSTARLLESLGYEVVSVEDGATALRTLEGARFDALVTDLNMPGLTGDELARQVSVRHPGLPVVMTSGDGSPRPGTLTVPARAFIPKPASREALKAALADASARSVGSK